MTHIILFDVNETLLDLEILRPQFERIFGTPATMNEWFARLLHTSLVVSLTKSYADFGTLAGAELDLLAARHGIHLSPDDRDEMLMTMGRLPPHPEVAEALKRMRSAGFRLATLTNSSSQFLANQISNASLGQYFEMLLSVDEVRLFKPAAETYQMAARKLGTSIDQLWLVAAHDWDVHGAIQAGCKGAFVARHGRTYHPLYEPPHVRGRDLSEVVDRIMEIER